MKQRTILAHTVYTIRYPSNYSITEMRYPIFFLPPPLLPTSIGLRPCATALRLPRMEIWAVVRTRKIASLPLSQVPLVARHRQHLLQRIYNLSWPA